MCQVGEEDTVGVQQFIQRRLRPHWIKRARVLTSYGPSRRDQAHWNGAGVLITNMGVKIAK